MLEPLSEGGEVKLPWMPTGIKGNGVKVPLPDVERAKGKRCGISNDHHHCMYRGKTYKKKTLHQMGQSSEEKEELSQSFVSFFHE